MTKWTQILMAVVLGVVLCLGAVGVNAFEHTTHTVTHLTQEVKTLKAEVGGAQNDIRSLEGTTNNIWSNLSSSGQCIDNNFASIDANWGSWWGSGLGLDESC